MKRGEKIMTDELKEKITWQNINSSKEREKILKGKIIAIEEEKVGGQIINCAIVDFRGIKVLIPAQEMIKEGKNDKKIIRNMMGSEIQFVVLEIDRTASKAVASRTKAMDKILDISLKKIEIGDKAYGKVVGTWRKYIRLYCLGTDFTIDAKDLEYGFVNDATKLYKNNDEIKVIVKEIDKEDKKIKISIKDLIEDPFKNIRKDFTEGGEYLAKVTGYSDNGIYANISQGIDTICSLPPWLDAPPLPGNKVIIKIYRILPEKRRVYSSIIKILGGDDYE